MNLVLDGSLSLGPGKQACGEGNGPNQGPTHQLILLESNAGPEAMSGLFEQTIDSENAPVDLPFDPELRATVTFIQTLKGAEFEVTYTFADDTTVALTQAGMSLIEHDSANPVKGIAVQGSGKIRWLATGDLA